MIIPDPFNFGHPTFRDSGMKEISRVHASYVINIIPNFKRDCLKSDINITTIT